MSDAAASAAPIAAEVPATETQAPPADSGALPSFKGTKHKIKINGQEQEVEYDELLTGYQVRKASDAKFQSAKKLADEAELTKKEYQEFLKDPWSFAKKNGLNPYDLAEKLLLEKLEYENLSDDQKARLAAERERDEAKKRLEAKEKAELEAQRATVRTQALKEIDDEIGAALEAIGKKPTPRLVARVVETMIAHLSTKDGERPKATDVLTRVRGEYTSDIREYLGEMSVEELKGVLSKKQLDDLRKADVAAVMAQDPMRSRPKADIEPTRKAGKSQRMSSDQFFNKLEKRFGG